jgi:serine/threonine protein phosphatase PrpC
VESRPRTHYPQSAAWTKEYETNLKYVLDAATRSDTGRVRSRNEDRVGEDLALGAVALADGMGGHHGGDVPSTLAVDTILRHLRATLPSIVPGEIDAATGYSKQSLAVRQAIFHATKAFMQRLNRNLNTETWARL